MVKKSNNHKQVSVLDKKWYVTVQKDSTNREMREIKAKDRFLIVGIFGVILMFLSPLIAFLFDIFKNLPSWVVLLCVLIFCFIIWFAVLKVKNRIKFFKNIECWNVEKKEVKIVEFEFSSSENDSWYYIILSDWEKKYRGFYCSWAEIIGKTDLELKSDEFYGKNWISLDLQDRSNIKKQLDEKISDLKLKRIDANFLERNNIDSEIDLLEYKKQDLETYHLHSQRWDFYIWDVYKIFIDLDDENNYILESEYMW